MKQVEWGRRIASMLAALILLAGAAVATSAEDLSRIVVFRAGTSQQAQQDAVERSGSRVLKILSLINGLAIELPADRAAEALQALQAEPSVQGVHANPSISAQGRVAVSAEGAGGDGAGGDGAGGDLVVYIQPAAAPKKESYSWGLKQIGVPEVHKDREGLNGNGLKVAILDTGIDRNHPELQGSIIGCVNARKPHGDCQDDNGHGTHIAGIIAAPVNKRGVIGIAPQVQIYAIKVLNESGAGEAADLINGLQVVFDEGIKLVNMSLGFPQEWGELQPDGTMDYPPLRMAIQALAEAGVIMVAAAGNRNPRPFPGAEGAGGDGAGGDGAGGDTPPACGEGIAQGAGGDGAGGDGAGGDTACTCSQGTAQGAGGDGAGGDGAGGDGAGGDGAGGDGITFCYQTTMVKFPAAYPWVIAVGATGNNRLVTDYSRSGPEMADHGVVAPGGSTNDGILSSEDAILSTHIGGGYGLGIGTSQATAHVTGAIALALQLNPQLTFPELLALLQDTATDVLHFLQEPDKSEWQGAGLIDVERMVE